MLVRRLGEREPDERETTDQAAGHGDRSAGALEARRFNFVATPDGYRDLALGGMEYAETRVRRVGPEQLRQRDVAHPLRPQLLAEDECQNQGDGLPEIGRDHKPEGVAGGARESQNGIGIGFRPGGHRLGITVLPGFPAAFCDCR